MTNYKRNTSSYALSLEFTASISAYGTSASTINNNIVIGSIEDGWGLSLLSCGQTSRVFNNNSAAYCNHGVVFTGNGACVIANGLSLYGNKKGIMMNPGGVSFITIQNSIFSDNGQSVTTRSMQNGLQPFFKYSNVHFFSFSRVTKSIVCPTVAAYLLQTSMNSESLPLDLVPTAAFEEQCTGAPFMGRLFLINSGFYGWND